MKRFATAALVSIAVLCAQAALPAPAFALSDKAIAALKTGGHVILMRHTQTTPGVGDPEGFKLDDCSTQRNLSEAGRADARRFGEELRKTSISIDRLLSSAWCRCVDTAQLAFPDKAVQVDASLNSIFGVRDEAKLRTQRETVRATIAAWSGPGNLLMVSHQQNISAIAGESLAQGAMLILKPKPRGFDIIAETQP